MKQALFILFTASCIFKMVTLVEIMCNTSNAEIICENKVLNGGDIINMEDNTSTKLKLKNCVMKNIYGGFFKSMKLLLDTVQIMNSQVESIDSDAFNNLTQLIYLDLEFNKISKINKDMLRSLSGLKTLYLNDNPITTIEKDSFSSLTNLKNLHLYNNKLTHLNDDSFLNLTNLELLSLKINKISTIAPNAFLHLKKLKQLELQYNQLVVNLGFDATIFSGLFSLHHLYLHMNLLTVLPTGLFQDLNNLEYLDVSSNKLSKLMYNSFTGLSRLKTLKINNNQLRSLSGQEFIPLINLEHLEMANNLLVTVHEVEVLLQLPRLQKFDLSNNTFQCEALSTISDVFGNILVPNIKYSACNKSEEVQDVFQFLAKIGKATTRFENVVLEYLKTSDLRQEKLLANSNNFSVKLGNFQNSLMQHLIENDHA